MNKDKSSQIVADPNSETENEMTSSDRPETILETQPVSVSNPESNNSFELKKWIIAGGVVIVTIAVCIIFAKETEVCFFSTCNDYSDPLTTNSLTIGNDFLAYAGGAATLVVLTTLVGIPLLPAVALSTGVWFLVQMIP